MDFRVFSRNISENMHARCVREDTKQALKENLQADGVQSRQTLFVRYCLDYYSIPQTGNAPPSIRLTFPAFFLTFLSHHSMPRVSRNMPMRMVVPCSACDSAVMV